MNLVFEKENHRYLLDGLSIPSVTQIISNLINLGFVSAEILKEKADLGTKVHLTTEFYDKGTLDLTGLHPMLKQYLDSWIKFRKDFGFEPTEIELRLAHPILRYAGTIDRVGIINGKKVLLDIKSGSVQKAHEIQTAGYEELYNYGKKKIEHIKKRMLVYLRPDGYKVEENKNANDRSVFLSCLTIYNYKRSVL